MTVASKAGTVDDDTISHCQQPQQAGPIPHRSLPRKEVPVVAHTLQSLTQLEGTKNLKPRPASPASLHSSFNDGSDMDQVDEISHAPSGELPDKDKKRRWRLTAHNLGINNHAEVSSSTVSSTGHRPRTS
jgi:GTPase-activating protein SAC7